MPTVLNAAGSGEGRDFATTNADLIFTIVFDPQKSKGEIEGLRARARGNGREVAVLTTVYVVCRPTEQEAKDYYAYYVDQNADWERTDRLMSGIIAHSKTFRQKFRTKSELAWQPGTARGP
jgi:alkanesulfonate monooxygenase SsuD/methylene tetrahydromethanopterin reductase-like flavin-dependent oxidoreductase (luciferase family)